MKELSVDEKFLVEYVPHIVSSFKLAKYYETDDEERSEIPDIWDVLNDALDEAEAEYDKARLDFSRKDPQAGYRGHRSVESASRRIAAYNSLLDKVSESKATYFLYNLKWDACVIPVTKEERPIYGLVLKDNKKLSFRETGETAQVWVVSGDWGGYCSYETTSKSGQAVMVDQAGLKLGGLYVFAQLQKERVEADIADQNYFVCSDCRRYFNLTDGEISFYKQKGLFLPKRCKKCRAIKKSKQANQRTAAELLKDYNKADVFGG